MDRASTHFGAWGRKSVSSLGLRTEPVSSLGLDHAAGLARGPQRPPPPPGSMGSQEDVNPGGGL